MALFVAAILVIGFSPIVAHATYPGVNGKIAYVDRVTDQTYAIFIAKDGQFTYPLAGESDYFPAWSPDGKRLAFVRRSCIGSTGSCQRLISRIFVVNEDGLDEREIFSTETLVGGQPHPLYGESIENLAWNQAGNALAFLASEFFYNRVLWTLVVPDPETDGQPYRIGTELWNFDWGPGGMVSWCMDDPKQICVVGGVPFVARFSPDLPEWQSQFRTAHEAISWWPTDSNRRKLAFVSNLLGQGFQVMSVEYDSAHPPGSPKIHTPNEMATCPVNPQVDRPRYSYRNPVPSPDGKFLLVHRVEGQFQDDGCDYLGVGIGGGWYLFRETGALQGLLMESSASQIAWQPAPANLAVHVTDGHGHSLDRVKVELLKPDLDEETQWPPTIGPDGVFTFDGVTPREYRLRVTLQDDVPRDAFYSLYEPEFDIRHGYPASEAAWITRSVTVSSERAETPIEFEFANTGEGTAVVLASNLGSADWERLDDLAAIYWRLNPFVEWVRSNLTHARLETVNLHAFVTTLGGETFAADRSASLRSEIFMGTGDSAYESRDDNGDESPVNGEWHEFSHTVYRRMVRDYDCSGQGNHDGYANPSTCDSLQEGFATFLPAWMQGGPDYVGFANLEAHNKPWQARGGQSLEDICVASLFWDLVDDSVDSEYTLAIASTDFHLPVTYTDDVRLSLDDLWRILRTSTPQTIDELHTALGQELQFALLLLDLDNDGISDVNRVDPLFLMNGFFRIDLHQLRYEDEPYHYDVAEAGERGDPRNADIGMTSHYLFMADGVVSETFLPRSDLPRTPEANIEIRAVDASGTPLAGADLELTIGYPAGDQTIQRSLGDQESARVHLELPAPFDRLLPVDAPPPVCNPTTDLIIPVSLTARLNGFVSADTPGFDNCAYTQAMANATGEVALSFEMRFPEDSTPPVTTAELHTVGEVRQNFTTGAWTVDLKCDDPVEGGFASGCWRLEYSLDGSPFAQYTEGVDITVPGLHHLEYRSIDAAGNVGVTGANDLGVATAFENVRPVTTLVATPSTPVVSGYTSGFWTIAMSCVDPVAAAPGLGCLRTEYYLDTPPFVTYQGPITLSTPGMHSLTYHSIDMLGNQEVDRVVFLGVAGDPDITPPWTQLSVVSSGPRSINFPDDQTMGAWIVSVSFCQDNASTPGQIISGCSYTEYSLDGGPFQPFEGELTISGVGLHTFAYRSIDLAGNVESIRTRQLEVVPPSDLDGDGVLDFGDNCHTVANSDQWNTDGDYYGNRCDADFNGNGTVDSNDGSLLKALLGSSGGNAPDQDLDGDGSVTVSDMNILETLFRRPPGPAYGYDSIEIPD